MGVLTVLRSDHYKNVAVSLGCDLLDSCATQRQGLKLRIQHTCLILMGCLAHMKLKYITCRHEDEFKSFSLKPGCCTEAHATCKWPHKLESTSPYCHTPQLVCRFLFPLPPLGAVSARSPRGDTSIPVKHIQQETGTRTKFSRRKGQAGGRRARQSRANQGGHERM